ncbi:hypothetical protein LTR86_000181 [Recurvomyces mirabilis]|nr:hypothetical protein LTR86_000181 [Recurvomyces mirabilis]
MSANKKVAGRPDVKPRGGAWSDLQMKSGLEHSMEGDYGDVYARPRPMLVPQPVSDITGHSRSTGTDPVDDFVLTNLDREDEEEPEIEVSEDEDMGVHAHEVAAHAVAPRAGNQKSDREAFTPAIRPSHGSKPKIAKKSSLHTITTRDNATTLLHNTREPRRKPFGRKARDTLGGQIDWGAIGSYTPRAPLLTRPKQSSSSSVVKVTKASDRYEKGRTNELHDRLAKTSMKGKSKADKALQPTVKERPATKAAGQYDEVEAKLLATVEEEGGDEED